MIKKFILACAFSLFGAAAAFAQSVQPMVPLGYCQIAAADLAAAKSLTFCASGIPTGANAALLQAEAAPIRFRDDGTAPTASVGNLIINGLGGQLFYTGSLSAIILIAASGSPILDVAFYKLQQ